MSGNTDPKEIKSDVTPETPPEEMRREPGSPQSAAVPEPAPTTKSCPYCAKTLDVRAVTCRFCGRDLYSAKAMKIVLTSEEWDTNVPQWMIEAEEKMLAQKRLLKRIRKQSWRIVAGVIILGVGVMVWRILTKPPDPHEQLLTVRTEPLVAKPLPQPTPSPEAIVPSLTQSAVATAFGGDVNVRGYNAIDDREEPPPVATPVPDAVGSPLPVAGTNAPEPPSDATNANAGQSEYEIHISAEDLVSEFEAERTFADEKYLGQKVQITGVLKLIDTTTKIPYILFDTGARNQVKCLLKPEAKKQLYRVKPGRLVVVRGTCDGAFLDIVISDCEFLF